MNGPPSSVDIGGDSSSSSTSQTYYEKKYGGGGTSSTSAGGPPPGIDISSFVPSYTETDKDLALFRLILACSFILLGVISLTQFYRSRWILDIRTRSARLVMIGGICVVFTFFVAINSSLIIIWDSGLRWFWSSLLLFFITPVFLGSYICRALRLAVVFHPRAKRALPWLIPERNYICVLLILGVAMLTVPVYHEYTLKIWEIIPKQTDILVTISLVFAGILACLYPFIRKVDDLFNISTELAAVTALTLFFAIGQKLVAKYGGDAERRWIGNHINLFFSAAVFGASVVDPLRRLAFDPLAASKRNYADRVLLSRREGRSTGRTGSSGVSSGRVESEDEGRPTRLEEGSRGTRPTNEDDRAGRDGVVGHVDDYVANPWFATSATVYSANHNHRHRNGSVNHSQRRGSAGGGGGGGGRDDMEVWDFERLATTPLLAAAFEDFSRKALCHESVLFLSEVSRYQNDDFSTPTPGGAGPSQYNAFCYITDTFIKAGSREEVNISDTDKKRILLWYHKGQNWFEQEDDEGRRMVFGPAYVEVRNMLEANILRRFLRTDQFKSVRAQREHVTAMMDSPQDV